MGWEIKGRVAAPGWDGADINEELIVWNIFEWTKQSQSLSTGLFLTFPIHGSIPSLSLELFFRHPDVAE